MGRARFLFYTGFIIFLTARPWAERGSCFTRDLLLFFFMSVTRRKPPLGQIVIGTESRNLGCSFAKNCWNNECTENVADIVFFIVYKVYFLLVLSKRSIQSEC